MLTALDNARHIRTDSAQAAVLNGGIDIHDAARIEVGDDSHLLAALHNGQVAQDLGGMRSLAAQAALVGGRRRPVSGSAANGNALQIGKRVHRVLRGLRDDVVVVVVLPIQEVHRRRLVAAAERVQHAGGNIALRKAGL